MEIKVGDRVEVDAGCRGLRTTPEGRVKLSINGPAIELSGEGAGLPVILIFGSTPNRCRNASLTRRISPMGTFERDAFDPGPEGDRNVEQWNLRKGSGSGYYPVVFVGVHAVSVQGWTGLNDNRSISIRPEKGMMVKARFLLPNE